MKFLRVRVRAVCVRKPRVRVRVCVRVCACGLSVLLKLLSFVRMCMWVGCENGSISLSFAPISHFLFKMV